MRRSSQEQTVSMGALGSSSVMTNWTPRTILHGHQMRMAFGTQRRVNSGKNSMDLLLAGRLLFRMFLTDETRCSSLATTGDSADVKAFLTTEPCRLSLRERAVIRISKT